MNLRFLRARPISPLVALACLAIGGCAPAPQDGAEPASPSGGAHAQSPYAGQQERDIKAIAAEDIDALEAGLGVALGGLAKPAELNAHPGPRHVLDLREELALDEAQTAEIQAVYDAMHEDAVRLGQDYLSAERAIDRGFAEGTLDEEALRVRLRESAEVYAELRHAHLAAHLATVEILSPEQVATYDELRGYGEGDPCDRVPEGHDPAMWRLHNGCEDEG